jgi:hypothetical protein
VNPAVYARSSAVIGRGNERRVTLVELSTRLNPWVSAVLRSPFHWLLSPGLMLITVTGRRTGRRYTIPVGYHEMPDALVILVGDAPAKQWWRNYREPGGIEVWLRNRSRHGVARVLPAGSAEFRARLEASFQRSRLIPWLFGIDFDPAVGLTDEQVRRFDRSSAVVKVS